MYDGNNYFLPDTNLANLSILSKKNKQQYYLDSKNTFCIFLINLEIRRH